MQRLLAFAALGALLLAPSSAAANGRYPLAGQVVVDPSNEQHLAVRATYGLMVTKDGGKNWGWVCEPAIGYGGYEDPMMAMAKDGSLLAGLFEGLSVSPDACSWSFYGPLAKRFVVDLSMERAAPEKGVLVVSNNVTANTFLSQLWETTDSGKTWTQAGLNLPDVFIGLTVDLAPSDHQRVYVSGREGPPKYPGALQRTKDRGKTWERLAVPGTDDEHLPFIGAVDPHDAERLYVRLNGVESDTLIVTSDGGDHWKTVFEAKGTLLGFALSPDGSKVAIGGEQDGIWMAPSDTLAFERISDVGARCLTWTQKGLYACADEPIDGFEVGLSTDEAKTFTPIMHLQKTCPLVCDAETSVGKQCAALWNGVAITIDAQVCPGYSTGVTGGANAASSGGGETPEGSGCCSTAPGAPQKGAAAPLALGILAWAVRRATRRRSSC